VAVAVHQKKPLILPQLPSPGHIEAFVIPQLLPPEKKTNADP